jgi:hypothetical protein
VVEGFRLGSAEDKDGSMLGYKDGRADGPAVGLRLKVGCSVTNEGRAGELGLGLEAVCELACLLIKSTTGIPARAATRRLATTAPPISQPFRPAVSLAGSFDSLLGGASSRKSSSITASISMGKSVAILVDGLVFMKDIDRSRRLPDKDSAPSWRCPNGGSQSVHSANT